MGLTKAEIEDRQRSTDLATLRTLLGRYRAGPYSDPEEFMDALGYVECRNCESVARNLTECQVCNDQFCEDCQAEHAQEETGF